MRHGKEEIRQFFQMMMAAFPDLHIQNQRLLAGGDHVIGEVILNGTHQGTFNGIAPTHRKAQWHGCIMSEFRNWKIVRCRVYSDNVALFRQLGILPAKAVSA